MLESKPTMWKRIRDYIRRKDYENNLAVGFARGAATAGIRAIDPKVPLTWEFSAFSQNSEDGIIDFLTSKIKNKDRFFFEIGSSDGRTNNSSWLAFGRKYSGVMVEGNPILSARAKKHLKRFNLGVTYMQSFVNKENCVSLCTNKTPDFFSIDIDGIDWYIAETLLKSGFRPKVFCCEYNAAFGPDLAATVEYRPDFARSRANGAWFYYGVSIAAWKKLLAKHGYTFVTVDSRGCNAFFIDAKEFEGLPEKFEGADFVENFADLIDDPGGWKDQLETMQHLPLVKV
jgi:hypothetical protein